MKKIKIFTLLLGTTIFLGYSFSASASVIHTSSTYCPNSIACSSDGHVFAVTANDKNDNGHIYINHKGKWVYRETYFNNKSLSAIAMSSDGMTIAVAGDIFQISANGGESWIEHISTDMADISSVAMSADGTTIVGLKRDSSNNSTKIMKSTDRGATWTDVSLADNFSGNAIAMSSSSTGHCSKIIIGGATSNGEGEIAISDDEGKSWKYISFTEISYVSSIAVNDKTIVLAGNNDHTGCNYYDDYNGYLIESTDGGTTWGKTIYKTSVYHINTVSISDKDKIIMAEKKIDKPHSLVIKKIVSNKLETVHRFGSDEYNICCSVKISKTGGNIIATGYGYTHSPYVGTGKNSSSNGWYSGVIEKFNI
jgi:photosystem II stability/assembly factor-like uncharacterized protein